MLLNFWSFETHSFSDNEQYTPSDSCFVDVSDSTVSCTFDGFGRLSVDHDRACPNDFFNFGGGWAVLQIATVQPEFFLNSLNFPVTRDVRPDVQFSSNHVSNQYSQSLRSTSSSTNRSCKMDGNESRTVEIVEQSHFADSFQWCNKNGFC